MNMKMRKCIGRSFRITAPLTTAALQEMSVDRDDFGWEYRREAGKHALVERIQKLGYFRAWFVAPRNCEVGVESDGRCRAPDRAWSGESNRVAP
jgi:hypothetical protein